MNLRWWALLAVLLMGVGVGWLLGWLPWNPMASASSGARAGDPIAASEAGLSGSGSGLGAGSRFPGAATPPGVVKQRQGGLSLTFLVVADTHIGFGAPENPGRDPLIEPMGIELTNLAMIDSMNTIAGTDYPAPIGGQVQTPRALLVAGDLTEVGGKEQWRLWTRIFGLTGKEGAPKFPVFEGAGNHDRNKNWHVREQVAKRHGGRFYYFDLGDLRLVCLDEGPDDEGLKVLAEALAGVAPDVPVIVYFHYPLQGPFSDDHWFGRGDYRARLARTLANRRVLGIFHGHYHATGAYRWQGIDVYNVGSPKNTHKSYAVVEVTDDSMKVAAYEYVHKQWIWWHRKPITPQGPEERIGVAPDLDPPLRPDFDLGDVTTEPSWKRDLPNTPYESP